MSGLGDCLKKSREDAGWNLKKFADASKIQIKYLERLEGGQYEKLPAFVYVQGFLKKYAQILELPLTELLIDYQREAGLQKEKDCQNLTQIPELKSPRFILTPKKISWAIIGLVTLLIVGYFIYQLNFLLKPPKLLLDSPAQDTTIETASIEISGQSDLTVQLSINGQQIFISADGRFHQQINLSPGLNTLKIEAVNRFGKKSEITRQIIVK